MKYLIGIQPTDSRLHIGNYLGCIKLGLEKQKEGHQVIFMIANLHARTTLDKETIEKNWPYIYKELKTIGCKNIQLQGTNLTEKVTDVFQELLTKVSYGTLARMPQFKDKKETVEFDMGLLTYPLLMAADIICYDPDVVIVGQDQIHHIELTNDLAPRIGIDKTFEYELSEYSKIMSLMDPSKKMSKSLGDKHVLYLKDDWAEKLRAANTNEAGLANLQRIGLGIGLDRVDYVENKTLKLVMAGQMEKLFGAL